MIFFNIDRRYKALDLEPILFKAAEAALIRAWEKDADLTIAIGGDVKVQKLNRQFRGESRATDVLSFPSEEIDAESGSRYLGDVIISLPRARAQAKKGKHSLDEELQLLAVHGVLHLLGYDHAEPHDKERMWAVQGEILRAIGVNITTAHAEEPHLQH